MAEKIVFFAYKGKSEGTHDENIDSIKHAVKEFNGHQKKLVARTWEDYKKTTHISVEVLKAIAECEIFVCDLTYFNHNVLFELGFAIAKRKKILILLNPDIEKASERYREFFLKEVRYTPIRNAKDIQVALQNKCYEDDLLGTYINTKNILTNSLDILYIKSIQKNQASIDLGEKIQFLKENHNLSLLVDDPCEVAYRSEAWYFTNIYKSKCVIIHFWGENIKNAFKENAQNSFLAGLSSGFDQKVILVAPSKFRAPLDYYEILTEYEDSNDLVSTVDAWLTKNLISEKILKEIEVVEEHELNLYRLRIGSEIAEYEKEDLLKYFVETSSYLSALNKEKVIIVGRKGSGKSAIYIKLLDKFSNDSQNYIINIKPESDELLEDIHLTDSFKHRSAKKSFFIAAWKLVIFSKLAYAVFQKNSPNEIDIDRKPEEELLINFVRQHESFMKMNIFGVILEINKKLLEKNMDINSPRILEELYSEYLGELIRILKKYFKSIDAKYSRIIIIADNLDKAWDVNEDLDIQSEMIAALLEVGNKIELDLVNKNNNPVNFKTVIFLRKDIFQYILKNVSEPDKLSILKSEINWEDYPELLEKVIENRFKFDLNLEEGADMNKVWNDYFEIKKNIMPFDKIKNIVTLRPRDVIYFVSQLLDSAINRGGEKVNDDDFNSAITNYTSFLNENLIAETKAEYPEISEILAKLQEYHGTSLEYKTFSKILDFFNYNLEKQKELTKVLFERGYMLGFDNATKQPFADIDILFKKLKEKKWFIFPKKVYIIAHAKYYAIKNTPYRPF